MALISLQNINIAFGGEKLLDDLSLQIEKTQRVCLLGRNGAGKSTLMKIINGEINADDGDLRTEPNIRISYLDQQIPQNISGTVFDIVAKGNGIKGKLLVKYFHLEKELAQNSGRDHAELTKLHDELDSHHAWPVLEDIDEILSRMSLDKEWEYAALSGGQKRRVLLASALVSGPDLLLLDEPTNHLDIASIQWLETFLIRSNITVLFVTHDRMFLRKLATRIIELDRGKLADWSCDYDTFLTRKQAVLDIEEKEWNDFDKKLAIEETWIRQGIKARRTRNEGRVRALVKMREERENRRLREGSASMKLADAQRSGKLVMEVKDISYSYDQTPLIKNFNTIITRGDKIGIIGPNGCGKTTLINMLMGNLKPGSGNIRHGENLSITYFDQQREQLDEEKTVWENVLPNGQTVTVDGKSKHVITYLQDFLFTPDRVKSPVKQLSGGERNRLLLARLFTKSANVLVFDEPTNDLDAETLELLEALLVEFEGTLLLISHDRTFINNVVTSTFVFEDKGKVKEYVGGYDDWISQRKETAPVKEEKPAVSKKQQYREVKKAKQVKKLTFKEKQELKELPIKIEKLETEQREIHTQMTNPDFYKNKGDVVSIKGRLAGIEEELLIAYERWEQLEEIEGLN